MHACTIIAANYLAYARVLSESFLDANPEGVMHVLVLDDRDDRIQSSDESFEVVRPADLPIDETEFHTMAAIYDVMELATALKPFFLRSLLASGHATVTYLDPDIKVYADLSEIERLALLHPIVLTPHTTCPLPRDDRYPSELDILTSGTHNLGFIAVGPGSEPFLAWWEERLARDCRVDIAHGIFVDQRWIDLAVHYFDHHVLRDPSYNVAYWNLHERSITWRDHGLFVGLEPLHFFHFSGFDPRLPQVLSTHMRDKPRHLPVEGTALEPLLVDYAADLVAAGHEDHRREPYGWARTATGGVIHRHDRVRYLTIILDPSKRVFAPDPFVLGEAPRFEAWQASEQRRLHIQTMKQDFITAGSWIHHLAKRPGRRAGHVVARAIDMAKQRTARCRRRPSALR